MATRTRSSASTAVLEPQAVAPTTRGGKGKAAAAPAPVEADLTEDDFEDEDDILDEGDDLLDDEEELNDEEELDDIEPGDAPAPATKVDPASMTSEQRAQNVAARITATVHSKTGFSLKTEPTKTIEKAFVFGIAGMVTSSALAQGLPKDKAAEVRATVLELMGNPGSNQKPATPRDKQLVQRTMENLPVWIEFARLYYPLSADDGVALHQILELNSRDLNRVSSMSRNGNGSSSAPSSDELY